MSRTERTQIREFTDEKKNIHPYIHTPTEVFRIIYNRSFTTIRTKVQENSNALLLEVIETKRPELLRANILESNWICVQKIHGIPSFAFKERKEKQRKTMATGINRSRVWAVAAALVLFLEGGTIVLEADAFVLPSGLATQRNVLLPELKEEQNNQQQSQRQNQQPLRSFKFIKGETSYGELTEGAGSSVGFGGTSSLGTNSFSRGTGRANNRRNNRRNQWWSASSGFSRGTPTTLLAAGSLESWPVMEADDIQVLVRKGEDLEDDLGMASSSSSSSSSVKATLERWERDISLEVVGQDGYSMLGNQMQPNNGYNNNNGYNSNESTDQCTQSISFDVADGDVYPFSGTISVPPPLTVEDSIGNQKTVMMVLNNPDDENADGQFSQQYNQQQQEQYDEYGNLIPMASKKPSSIEAMLEPLYKSPDQKYAEAQQQQQLQYDDYGNEIYNPQQQQQYGEEKTTIPSQGYQSFQLDATDPATGKIKISLERDDNSGGGGFGGAFGGNGGSSAASEARIEIHHGFRDQYGNPYSNSNNNYNENSGEGEQDRRISLEVSTMHPTFSSVVDTMPANLLAKHALPSLDNVGNLDFIEPYLEVRIVNTGGAAIKAGVQSFMPQYRPQSQKERKNFEQQKYRYEQQQFQKMGLGASSTSTVKADDPFLLVDSAQSTTSSRRIKNNRMNVNQGETAYVRASQGRSNNAYANTNMNTNTRGVMNNNNNRYERNGFEPSISEMWSTGSAAGYDYRTVGGGGGMKANMPGEDFFRDTTKSTSTFVQANASNRHRALSGIQSRVNPNYYDAIDTYATPKGGNGMSSNGNIGLIANNDFSKASSGNGARTTSAIVPGSMSGRGSGFNRRVSPQSSLQSFGGNSGGASGMQQPFQQQNGRQYQSQTQNNQYQSQQNNNQYDYQESQSQSFGGSNNYANTENMSGIDGMRQRVQERSERQSLQQSFSQQTSPQRTRTLQGQQGSGRGNVNVSGHVNGRGNVNGHGRTSSAFSGNGNVIGNGVVSGRPADSYSDFGNGNDNNNGFGGRAGDSYPDNGFQQSQSSFFQSTVTPEASKTFGGRGNTSNNRMNNNNSGFGRQGNSGNNLMGSMKQKLEDTFGGNSNNSNNKNFGNNNRNSGGFGEASNNSNNNKFGNANSRSGGFGGASNNNRNSGGFGGASNNSNNNKFGNANSKSGGFGGASNSNNNKFGNANSRSGGFDGASRGNSNFGGNTNNNSGGFGGASNSNNNSGGFGGASRGNSNNNNNKFGGNANSNSGGFGGASRGNANSNSGGFGGASNSNNKFGGNANSNSGGFGGPSSNNNKFGGNANSNSGGFGGASNNNNGSSGSPFGKLGTPPQTRANSKNPFAKLNGETNNQQQTQFNSNSSNNAFGGAGGGRAPQRPNSPSPSAMKNPFAGLNGNNARGGPGRATTAMRSSNSNTINNGSSGDNENPIVGFAKNLVRGIGDIGNR